MVKPSAHTRASKPGRAACGFTMIELIVVLAVIALLLSLALPRYVQTLDRGKRQIQQQDLALMREAIDKFYGDHGRYPDQLSDLVRLRYLRAIPVDPYSERADWEVVPPEPGTAEGAVFDVRPDPGNAPPAADRAPGASAEP